MGLPKIKYLACLADHVVDGHPEPKQPSRYFSQSRDYLFVTNDKEFDEVFDFLIRDTFNYKWWIGGVVLTLISLGFVGILNQVKVVESTYSIIKGLWELAAVDEVPADFVPKD